MPGNNILGNFGGADGSSNNPSAGVAINSNSNASVAGGASNHHTGMGMSSGGQNMHLMNMVESGDADDGGRITGPALSYGGAAPPCY